MDRTSRRITRLLRAYPPSWRHRYGEELRALIEDTHPDGHLSLRNQLSVVGAGLRERGRATGLTDGDDASAGVRSGALLVLCAWSILVVGGSAFAKFSEHWDAVTPSGSREVPAVAYTAVVVGALLGAALIGVAAASVMPALVGFLRGGGWPSIRRVVLRATAISAVAALATAGVVMWAHHIGPDGRNTGFWPYGIAALLWAALLVAALASWTAAVVAITRRLELTDRLVRVLGSLAMLAVVPMALVASATFVWWYEVAIHAPSFFTQAGPGSDGSTLAPMIVGAALLMVTAVVVGAAGAIRVRSSLRDVARA